MNDITKQPYSKWLEESLKVISEFKPACLCIAATSPDGETFTGYYNADATDKAVFAHHIQSDVTMDIADTPTVDAVPVVRCRGCINAEPLERNCEVNANFYMHCRLWRGEECKNVWHKYKRYYRDYSLVQHDDFCSSGERKEGDRDA